MIRRSRALVPILTGALALASCGGGSSTGGTTQSSAPASGGYGQPPAASTTAAPAPAAAAGALAVAADPSGALMFTPTALKAKAGKVTIDFTNASSVPHGLVVENPSGDAKTKIITGGKATLTTTLKAGNYEFYCPVPGHKAAGMKGTLTVS